MQAEDAGPYICWDELSADEALLLLRRSAAEHDGQSVSGFLDTHQWVPLANAPGIRLDGGHPRAQFRRAAINLDVVPLRVSRLALAQLPNGVRTARQLRGWLYRNGAPDSTLGDIVVADEVALVADPQLDFARLELAAAKLNDWPEPRAGIKRTTAAGPRADAVVSALFSVSRGEAQTAIKHGFVFVDFHPLAKRTQMLAAGQEIVFRTKGRASIVQIELNPRSGRVWVEYRHYPC